MTQLNDSRTGRNLLAAFADECQASLRYAFYAKAAKKEGYEQISAVFAETSEQERVHARRMYKLMDGLAAEVTMPLRSDGVRSTLENLLHAAQAENNDGFTVYPEYAATAREEGFTQAAIVFANIALAEQMHMARFQALAENIQSDRVFARDTPVLWRCRHCGWAKEGLAAPERCPACDHPKAHFEISPSNW